MLEGDKKVAIIIGAGPAGLTAAYELLTQTDIVPIVIEEEGQVGGISKTVEYHGNRMDLGGHRFFSKSERVIAFWNKLMPVEGEEQEEEAMLIRKRVSRIFYNRKFFDYPISLKVETIKNLGFWQTLKVGVGYIRAVAFKREEHSLKDFMINRFGIPLYKMFFEDYTTKVWGRSPEAISADWGAQRIKGLSLWKAFTDKLKKVFMRKDGKVQVETSLIEQFMYPKKGPGAFWEVVAEEINRRGGEIRLDTKVIGLKNKDKKIEGVVVREGSQSRVVQGDYYCSSMPIRDLIEGLENPAPKRVREVASGLPYRDFITVGLLVDKLKLKNSKNLQEGLVPDCWIYIQEKDVEIGRLQIFNNWSPFMVKDNEHTVWLGLEYFCNEGDALWCLSNVDFKKMAIGELVRLGIIDEADVKDSTLIRVKKAYPAYFDTYEEFEVVKDYLSTYENLYCIGRNGQHRYNNMDHSMLTAMEAVEAITTKTTDKHQIWNVNSEGDYHEAKRTD